MLHVERDQVLAFRLNNHHLSRRHSVDTLPKVVAACGIRNTPPGSAAMALQARIADLTPDALDQALAVKKTLVEVLAMRISPHLISTNDLRVFTQGALPASEESLRAVLNRIAPALEPAGITATEALQLAVNAAHGALEDGMLERGALSAAMSAQLPDALCPWCEGCKSRHVSESLFRLVGVYGLFVIVSKGSKDRLYVRADHWLRVSQVTEPAAARAELLRRFLRCFGPSTLEHFAAWVGITPAYARLSWGALLAPGGSTEQLVAVELEGRKAWVHAEDLSDLENPPQPTGVRLLPPYDAYLDQRDRDTLLHDRTVQRRVWQTLGNPGVVLREGQLAGVWRPQKKGKKLILNVESFAVFSQETTSEIEAEATALAVHRGCTSAQVNYLESGH